MKKVSVYIFTALLVQFVLLSSCKEKENESPTVAIYSPEEGDLVMGGDLVIVKVNAEDSDGSVEEVNFYIDYINVEVVTEEPYEYTWEVSDSIIGDVSVRAVAIDNEGGAVSHTINVVVDAPGGFNPDLSYGTVSDFDGNSYKTILIGNQNWMAENLKVSHYADGTPIPFVSDSVGWSNLGTSGSAYCWYDNSSELADTLGFLYSWAGAMNGASGVNDSSGNIQGVCPDGWHVPSDDEWKALEMELGMDQEVADKYEWRGSYEGGYLKEMGFSHWDNPNTSADNTSGFTALPGGFRANTGVFYGIRQYGTFWTATMKTESTESWYRALNYEKSHVYRYTVPGNRGASVRCVQDQ